KERSGHCLGLRSCRARSVPPASRTSNDRARAGPRLDVRRLRCRCSRAGIEKRPRSVRSREFRQMTVQPGTRLGIYEVTAPLGAGGMGEVYRARDTKLNPEVAIKVLPE